MVKICTILFLFSDSWAKAFSQTSSFLSLLTQPTTTNSGFNPTLQRRQKRRSVLYGIARIMSHPITVSYALSLGVVHYSLSIDCIIILAFCSRWESFLQSDLWEHHSQAKNVWVSPSPDSYGARIEIGGTQNRKEWKLDIHQLCEKTLHSQISYNSRPFVIDLHIQLTSMDSLGRLKDVLDIVAQYDRASTKGIPPIDLRVDVSRDDLNVTEDDIENSSFTFDHLGGLQKLTWKGPFAHILFDRPPGWWVDEQEPLFTRLRELRLLDCILSPDTLQQFILRCPSLLSCVVHHVGDTTGTDDLDTCGDTVVHPSLRRLDISSTVGLSNFFAETQFPHLEHLSLKLHPCSASDEQDDVKRLVLPWPSLRHFELKMRLDHLTLYHLRAFCDRQPSWSGREHSFYNEIQEWFKGLSAYKEFKTTE
ncbi:hypothetical protein M413DRAFT_11588 [Hebeloma cylindrosporum]|uniref:F-box domain-containing protein n=1 Tax=Hebeloma cylindrosporum TaxID=76867 RepID=A0A0C3C991_HEBCY|nr:hypothetical protein M413DRAFT_11588 [Hebeloma cylindrosporum h7]